MHSSCNSLINYFLYKKGQVIYKIIFYANFKGVFIHVLRVFHQIAGDFVTSMSSVPVHKHILPFSGRCPEPRPISLSAATKKWGKENTARAPKPPWTRNFVIIRRRYTHGRLTILFLLPSRPRGRLIIQEQSD